MKFETKFDIGEELEILHVKKIETELEIECPFCKGEGELFSPELGKVLECENCDGSGYFEDLQIGEEEEELVPVVIRAISITSREDRVSIEYIISTEQYYKDIPSRIKEEELVHLISLAKE